MASSVTHFPLRLDHESGIVPAKGMVVAASGPPSPDNYSAGHLAYLQDELARVVHLVRAFLLRDGAAGAQLTRDALLRREFRWDDPPADAAAIADHTACVTAAARLERQIVGRMRQTRDEVRGRIPAWELVRRFGLIPNHATAVPRYKASTKDADDEAIPAERDTVSFDLLLLAFLVDRFPAYRAALTGAAGGKLSAETALRIVQPAVGPADLPWAEFAPTAPLVANDLIAIHAAETAGPPTIAIDPRVAAYLVGDNGSPDPALGGAVTVSYVRRGWDTLKFDPAVTDQLQQLSAWWWEKSEGSTLAVLLHGAAGTPFLKVVQAFVNREVRSPTGAVPQSRPIVVVDAAAAALTPDWDGFVRRVYREAVLRRGVVLWLQAEAVLAVEKPDGRWEALIRRAELASVATFFASRVGWDPTDAFRGARQFFARVDLPTPSAAVRREIWKSLLGREKNPLAADTSPAERVALDLLETFEFTQGVIEDAIATARGLSLLVPAIPEGDPVARAAEALAEACRRQAARRPVSFTRRVPARASTAEEAADPREVLRKRVVLPAAGSQQLAELLDRMTHIKQVYRDLAFEQRLTLGRGLLVLFAGPPGTGKTLSATTLAGLLRKDLYKVDTAAVASRFVGETEKNLGRVFADVETANAVLFFDEADALFGRRGEVVQAADRWANLQVSFLLQRVEEFTGTVILATNARESIDPAFFRRFQVLIDFPRPDSASRLAILEGMVSGTAVGVADSNGRVATTPEEVRAVLKPVTDRFELTGGNLKNVLLDATFRAITGATAGAPILMARDFVLGVAREYQKEGKPVSVATFGKEWFGLVERELQLGRATAPPAAAAQG